MVTSGQFLCLEDLCYLLMNACVLSTYLGVSADSSLSIFQSSYLSLGLFLCLAEGGRDV